MDQLLEKLAISKAIMDKHSQIKRGQAAEPAVNMSMPELQEFSAPNASYNIPSDLISEGNVQSTQKSNQLPTKDLIMKSKLPDEIKKLMIENPITAANPMMNSSSILSDELVEKASKLMGTKKPDYEPARKINNSQPQVESQDLRKMIKEVVREVLKENGLIVESTSKSNEQLSFRVGQHIFEGKITKIKKLS